MDRPEPSAYVSEDRLDLVGLRRALEGYDGSLSDTLSLAEEAERALVSEQAAPHYRAIADDLTTGLQQRVRSLAGHDEKAHEQATLGDVYEHLDRAVTEAAMDVLEHRLGLSMQAERSQDHSYTRSQHVLGLLDRYLGSVGDDELRVTSRLRNIALRNLYHDPDHAAPVSEFYTQMASYARQAQRLPETTALRALSAHDQVFAQLSPRQQLQELTRAAADHGLALKDVSLGATLSFAPSTLYQLTRTKDSYAGLLAAARRERVQQYVDFDAMFSPDERLESTSVLDQQGAELWNQVAGAVQADGRGAGQSVLDAFRQRGLRPAVSDEEFLDAVESMLAEFEGSAQGSESLEELVRDAA